MWTCHHGMREITDTRHKSTSQCTVWAEPACQNPLQVNATEEKNVQTHMSSIMTKGKVLSTMCSKLDCFLPVSHM